MCVLCFATGLLSVKGIPGCTKRRVGDAGRAAARCGDGSLCQWRAPTSVRTGQGAEGAEPEGAEGAEVAKGAEGAEGAEQGADREGELRCKGARGPEAEPVADERPVARWQRRAALHSRGCLLTASQASYVSCTNRQFQLVPE